MQPNFGEEQQESNEAVDNIDFEGNEAVNNVDQYFQDKDTEVVKSLKKSNSKNKPLVIEYYISEDD